MEREAVEVPPEELRLALVLNGGVSLAVWMGGTVREMDALVRADRSGSGLPEGRYAAVLDLARTWASIDVVSGTSAGGVNGALLALSQVNANADLGMLRDLWAEQGQLDNLLRPPFRGQPTSLLQGDEYFLPALTRAMSGLTADFEPTHQDVDLMITTTLLGGALSVTTDGLGQRLPQRRHGERFRFSTSTEMGRTDDFTPERVERTSQAMALAARCTAGFPFAFEPSFVPVHEDPSRRSERRRNEPPGVERPDMAEWAGWERSPSSMRVSRDRSRFAMDGGVLANTPTREALDAIDRRPARRPMRRIMVLVYPHAPTFDPDDENADPADDAGRAPTVTDSLSGLLGALTSQGSLTFVEEIEAHNREAARWRGGRLQVLSGFLFEDLYELVRRAWRHYQSTRIRGAARNLADRVPRPDGWPYLRVVETAATGQLTWLDPSGLPLPYVPRRSPREEPPTLGDDQALSPRWEWGTTVALGLADSAAEILREALGVAVRGQELSSLRQALARVSDARDQMLTVRDEFDHAWWHREELAGVLPDPGYWQLRLICYRRAMHLAIPEDADTMRTLAAALRRERDGAALDAAQQARLVEGLIDQTATARAGAGTAAAVWDVVTALQAAADTVLAIAGDETRGPLTRLGPWGGVLDPVQLDGEPDDARLRLLTRLLTLDAATWLLADAESPGTSQEITLAQLSLGIDHHFAKASLTPDDKVAGNELHRFGGFLKRSWRINDWIWGRLDSAQMLCRLVLDPQRLLRIHALTEHSAEQLVTQLVETSYAGAEVPTDTSFVRLRQDAVDELSGLFSGDRTATDRGYLPRLARLAAHPVQQQIIVSELAALAAAVRSDVRDGASARSHGQHFLDEYAGLLDQIELAGPDAWHRYGAAALAAFDVAGIGREPLEDEARSDALIQTTVTTAASLVTLADSDRLGVRAVKPVTRTLRGAALVPYWLVSGLISGSSAARSLALLGFAIGGIVLTLGLLGVLGGLSSAGSALGAGIVLGALGFAALRSGTLLHGVVLLAPLGPLVALAVQLRADAGADGDYSSLTTVAAVLALVAGLALLASLPNPLRSPLATLVGSARPATYGRHRRGGRPRGGRADPAGRAFEPGTLGDRIVDLAARPRAALGRRRGVRGGRCGRGADRVVPRARDASLVPPARRELAAGDRCDRPRGRLRGLGGYVRHRLPRSGLVRVALPSDRARRGDRRQLLAGGDTGLVGRAGAGPVPGRAVVGDLARPPAVAGHRAPGSDHRADGSDRRPAPRRPGAPVSALRLPGEPTGGRQPVRHHAGRGPQPQPARARAQPDACSGVASGLIAGAHPPAPPVPERVGVLADLEVLDHAGEQPRPTDLAARLDANSRPGRRVREPRPPLGVHEVGLPEHATGRRRGPGEPLGQVAVRPGQQLDDRAPGRRDRVGQL